MHSHTSKIGIILHKLDDINILSLGEKNDTSTWPRGHMNL